MRLRRKDDGVVEHSIIDMGCSVLKDGSDAFTFAYYPWTPEESMLDFIRRSCEITKKAAAGLPLDPRPDRTNLMYGTTIPWISFTSFTHPKKGEGHSIPRTVFGKIFQREGKYLLAAESVQYKSAWCILKELALLNSQMEVASSSTVIPTNGSLKSLKKR